MLSRNFVLCSLICFFCTVVFFMFYTGMSLYAVDEFGVSDAEAGLLASLFVVGDLISRVYFGNKLHVYGIKRITECGMAAGTAVCMLYFVASGPLGLAAVRVLHGLTYGAVMSSVFTIAAEGLPPSRRGEGMGYFMLGLSVASALGPFVCMYLQRDGLYGEIFLIGLAASAAAAVCGAMIRDAGEERAARTGRVAWKTLFERSSLRISFIVFLFFFSYSGVLAFMSPYGRETGLSEYATYFFVFLSLGTMFCRLFLGRIYDLWGENAALVPFFLLYVAGMLMIGTTDSGWVLLLAGVLIGLQIAMIGTVCQAIIVKRAPKARYGVAISTYNIFFDLAYFAGPVVNGVLIGMTSHRDNYIAMAFVGLLSLISYLAMHGIKAHRRPEGEVG